MGDVRAEFSGTLSSWRSCDAAGDAGSDSISCLPRDALHHRAETVKTKRAADKKSGFNIFEALNKSQILFVII